MGEPSAASTEIFAQAGREMVLHCCDLHKTVPGLDLGLLLSTNVIVSCQDSRSRSNLALARGDAVLPS